MSKTKRAHRVRPQRDVSIFPCKHCGTERIIAPHSEFVGLNRKHPLPGMAQALRTVRSWLRSDDGLVSICPGCMCITADIHGC